MFLTKQTPGTIAEITHLLRGGLLALFRTWRSREASRPHGYVAKKLSKVQYASRHPGTCGLPYFFFVIGDYLGMEKLAMQKG